MDPNCHLLTFSGRRPGTQLACTSDGILFERCCSCDSSLPVVEDTRPELRTQPASSVEARCEPLDPLKDALVLMFSGDPVIGMLSAGQSLDYFLVFAKEALQEGSDLPTRYIVTASYWDASRQRQYSEPHILDLAPWGPAVMRAQPIDVIALQMRRLNEKLEAR